MFQCKCYNYYTIKRSVYYKRRGASVQYEDIFATISRRYGTFTHMEQKIADYVLAQGKGVPGMSICELAQACGVVSSTVSRFCRSVGVAGYREFRTALAVSLTMRQEANVASASPDPLAGQIRQIQQNCILSLEETCRLLQSEQGRETMGRLLDAERIAVLCANGPLLPAFYAHWRRELSVSHLRCSLDANEQRMLCTSLGSGDTAILFSRSDVPPHLLDILMQLRRRGCHLVLIAPTESAALNALADVTLFCGGFGGSEAIISAQAFLIALVCRLSLQRMGGAVCPLN